MEIWLVSLFDPTPIDEPVYPRFMEIALMANKKGHTIKHFTSTFRHINKSHRKKKSFVHKENEFYDVNFIKSLGYKFNFGPRRFIAHYVFAKKLILEFNKQSKKPNVIFISMPPLSTVRKVTKWGKSLDIPVVVDVIDPWPDSFIKDAPLFLKPALRPLLAPFVMKLKASFSNAAAITAISNDYLNWAKNFHTKEKLSKAFYLAINVDEIQKINRHVLNECPTQKKKIRLIYAGSMASSYDIPCILKAAVILEDTFPGKTHFVFTGKGPQLDMVLNYSLKYENIEYLGWLSKEELILEYGKADFGLIQHKNSLTQTITYKFFNYMSSGLVLLNSLQTEMATMIDKYNLGKNNKEMDYHGLAKNISEYILNPKILENHRENAINFTYKFGHVDKVYGDLVDFLESMKTNS